MKKILILLLVLSHFVANSQRDTSALDSLQMLESHISGQAFQMIHNTDENVRLTSTFFMIKNLVKAFKIRGSFDFPFDSVKAISILKSPDNKFRVFSWHLQLADGTNRQYGVIQINPEKLTKKQKKNKSLKLIFPLIDRSDSLLNPEDQITDNEKWFGAHYYSMIPFMIKKKTYYMLLGIDGWDKSANRKVIEVLSFENDKPVFGARVFKMQSDRQQARIIFTYDEKSVMALRWLADKQFVVYDNLIPKDGESIEMKKSYVPDGSFDYLKLEYGIWKQFFKLPDYYIESK